MTKPNLSVDISVNFGQSGGQDAHSDSHESSHKEPSVSGRGGFSRAQRSRPPYASEKAASVDRKDTAANTLHDYSQSQEPRASFQPYARYRGPNYFASIFMENDLLERSTERPQSTYFEPQPSTPNIPSESKSRSSNIQRLLKNSANFSQKSWYL
jgi:hypothetical protein